MSGGLWAHLPKPCPGALSPCALCWRGCSEPRQSSAEGNLHPAAPCSGTHFTAREREEKVINSFLHGKFSVCQGKVLPHPWVESRTKALISKKMKTRLHKSLSPNPEVGNSLVFTLQSDLGWAFLLRKGKKKPSGVNILPLAITSFVQLSAWSWYCQQDHLATNPAGSFQNSSEHWLLVINWKVVIATVHITSVPGFRPGKQQPPYCRTQLGKILSVHTCISISHFFVNKSLNT